MKTRRVFLLLSLLLSFALGMRAQNAVSIYQIDGKVSTFAFSEKPVVTYSGNDLVMSTTKTTVQYPIYLLSKLDFGDVMANLTVIDDVVISEGPSFSFSGKTITIRGGEPKSHVSLYHLNGMKAGDYRLDDQGCATIPVSGLSRDFYVVKTKHLTFKFRKL